MKNENMTKPNMVNNKTIDCWIEVPVSESKELVFPMIYTVLLDGRIPMTAQWRPCEGSEPGNGIGEWWTMGMSQAKRIDQGVTHFLKKTKVIVISDTSLEVGMMEIELKNKIELLQSCEMALEQRDESLTKAANLNTVLYKALAYFLAGWGNFLEKTNIKGSFYSAPEITYMNNVEIEADRAVEKYKEIYPDKT